MEWIISYGNMSVPQRNPLYDILRLAFLYIVAEQLQHLPFKTWAHYSTPTDR